jgi:hypothetical protein
MRQDAVAHASRLADVSGPGRVLPRRVVRGDRKLMALATSGLGYASDEDA